MFVFLLLFVAYCLSASLAEPLEFKGSFEITRPTKTAPNTTTIPTRTPNTTIPINPTGTPTGTAHGWNTTSYPSYPIPINSTVIESSSNFNLSHGWNTTSTSVTIAQHSGMQACWEPVPTGVFWPHMSGAVVSCGRAFPTVYNNSQVPSASAPTNSNSDAPNGSVTRAASSWVNFVVLFIALYLCM